MSKDTLFKQLIEACHLGNVNEAKRIVCISELDTGFTDLGDFTLRWAAENGHRKIVKVLLMLPEVSVKADGWDNYALRSAAGNNHLEIVQRLLTIPEVRKKAAAVDNHALRWASGNGHIDIVNCLLEIDLVLKNAAAIDNQALRWAILGEYVEVAARLLQVHEVLEFMKENQPTLIKEHQVLFDKMLKMSQARAILPRKLAEQNLTTHRLPFDIIVKILEGHSHAVICAKSQCDKSTRGDGQPYCALVYNYSLRATKRVKNETTSSLQVEEQSIAFADYKLN